MILKNHPRLRNSLFILAAGYACLLLIPDTRDEEALAKKQQKIDNILDVSEKLCGPQQIDPGFIPDPPFVKLDRLVNWQSREEFFGDWRKQLGTLLLHVPDDKLDILEQKAVLCMDPDLQEASKSFFGPLHIQGMLWQKKDKTYISLVYHPYTGFVAPVITKAALEITQNKFQDGERYKGTIENRGESSHEGQWTQLERPANPNIQVTFSKPNVRPELNLR